MNNTSLSKYKSGSFMEVIYISLPIMLMYLSHTSMFLCDRLVLSQFNYNSMLAQSKIHLNMVVFHLLVTSMAGITQVFVGQLNGAKRYKEMGSPVWQIVWLCLISALFFIPMAFYGENVLVDKIYQNEGLGYYQLCMSFTPLTGIVSGLSGFFTALGRVYALAAISVVVNVINLVLNIVFIMGVPNVIEPMGVTGAGIATVTSVTIHTVILAVMFLSKQHRQTHDTNRAKWDFGLMKKIISIGFPQSIGHVIEVFAWVQLGNILVYKDTLINGGKEAVYWSTFTVSQTIFVFFSFIFEGLSKAVTTITSNLIGSGNYKVNTTIKSATMLHLICMAVLAIPLLLFPQLITGPYVFNVPETYVNQANIALIFVWFLCLFDGAAWVIGGLLAGSGDTRYIMYTITASAWFIAFAPVYTSVMYYDLLPEYVWAFGTLFGMVNLLSFTIRLKNGKWKKNQII